MKPQIHTSNTIDEFIASSKEFIADLCPKIGDTTSSDIAIGLSGGSTPGPIYSALAADQIIDFTKVVFFQVDERYIPATDQDSNQKMIQETLLDKLPTPPKAFIHFNTQLPIQDCLSNYAQELKKSFPPTLTILGIGPDGHTASLFPNTSALNETQSTAHTTTEEFAIKDRLTITFPAIMSSQTIVVLLKGKSKQPILDKLLNSTDSIENCPAKKLLEHPNLHIFYGDF